MVTFGGFIIVVYTVASKQPFWWLIMLHEKLMVIREYSKFFQSEISVRSQVSCEANQNVI